MIIVNSDQLLKCLGQYARMPIDHGNIC